MTEKTSFGSIFLLFSVFLLFGIFAFLEFASGRWPSELSRVISSRGALLTIMIPPVVFGSVFALAFYIKNKGLRVVLQILSVAVYLRLVGSDLPLVISATYLGALILIGLAFLGDRSLQIFEQFNLSDQRWVPIFSLIYIALLIGSALVASAVALTSLFFEVSSESAILVTIIIVTLCSVYMYRRGFLILAPDTTPPRPLHGERSFAFYNVFRYLTILLIFFAFGMVAVPSGYFDAEWYGTASDHVLPSGSFFKPSHLQHFVYYYPKGFELLTYPLKSATAPGLVRAFSTFYGILSIVFLGVLMTLRAKSASVLWPFAAFVLAIPTVQVMLWNWKPDLLAATSSSIAFFLAILAIDNRNTNPKVSLNWSMLSFAFLLFSMSLKLTNYLVAPLLFLVLAITSVLAMCKIHKHKFGDIRSALSSVFLVMATLFFLFFMLVTLRTFTTTGVPVIGPSLSVFSPLEHLYHPTIRGESTDLRGLRMGFQDGLGLLWKIVFNPSFSVWHYTKPLLPTILVIFIFPIAFILFLFLSRSNPLQKGKSTESDILFALLVVFVFLLFGWAIFGYLRKSGGDSNYFLFLVFFGSTFAILVMNQLKRAYVFSLILVPAVFGSVFSLWLVSYEMRLIDGGWGSVTRHYGEDYLSKRRKFSESGAWVRGDFFSLRDYVGGRELERCRGYVVAAPQWRPQRWAYLIPCAVEGVSDVRAIDNFLRNSSVTPLQGVNFVAVEIDFLPESALNGLGEVGFRVDGVAGGFQVFVRD